jgi:hypothetical protein
MQITRRALHVLCQLYRMRSNDVPVTRPLLASLVAEPPGGLDQALEELTALGLIGDPSALRMTFAGLAVATAASPRRGRMTPPVAEIAARPIVKAVPRRAPRAPRPHTPVDSIHDGY